MATKEAHRCVCSPTCTATTRRVFAPGHDARMTGLLRQQAAEGKITAQQAYDAVTKVGGSELLAVKTRNSAQAAIDTAKAKANAKEQGKQAGKEVKARGAKPGSGVQRGATSASKRPKMVANA